MGGTAKPFDPGSSTVGGKPGWLFKSGTPGGKAPKELSITGEAIGFEAIKGGAISPGTAGKELSARGGRPASPIGGGIIAPLSIGGRPEETGGRSVPTGAPAMTGGSDASAMGGRDISLTVGGSVELAMGGSGISPFNAGGAVPLSRGGKALSEGGS